MVLNRSNNFEETMPQTVPSAGFTPPCDYSNFADNFDLSLLPGGDNFTPVSPSATFYTYSPPPMQCETKLKVPTVYYPNSPASIDENDINLGPDFQKLLSPEPKQVYQTSNIYLEVPSSNCYPSSPSGSSPYSPQSLLSPNDHFATFPSPNSDHQSLYPNSPPEISLYPRSPNSFYSHSSTDGYPQFIKKEIFPNSPTYTPYIKEESYLSPCASQSPSSPVTFPNISSPTPLVSITSNSEVLDLIGTAIIKQETTIDFDNILNTFHVNESIRGLLENSYSKTKPKVVEKSKSQDHQLLREVLRDTSLQKKYNFKPFPFDLMDGQIKMEEPDDACNDQLTSEKMDPVLNLAIEQMKKDVSNTCSALGILPDPSRWSPTNVLSWLHWTTNQFGLPAPVPDQWDLSGSSLVALTEEDFVRRAPQSGSILHAQLEIWKAAFVEEEFQSSSSQWMPESTSSNASSGDVSDEEEDEPMPEVDPGKPTTSRGTGSSHIHLWQFLKELLASPQTHGSCIRWIDRTKGIFKIEDSVKVARLWGKRKNRPAMNYDKLSRSIRQYYKKGIMKKTERSQRLVYQFCHPYNL